MEPTAQPTTPSTPPPTAQPTAQSVDQAAVAADSPRPQAGAGALSFTTACLEELRKVVWPSRQQLFSESVAVILMVGLSAAAIAAVDRLYGWAATQVFR